MEQKDKILEVNNLTVKFDEITVLENISFDVRKGEALVVIGPNGSGKSVMFRALLGLVPYSGEVKWAPGIKISYVPQKLDIGRELPLTVREFLRFKTTDEDKILKTLEMVGIKTEKSR